MALKTALDGQIKKSSLLIFLMVFGLVGGISAYLYVFWGRSEYSVQWEFLGQAPPGAQKIVWAEGGNSIYIQDKEEKVYQRSFREDRWIPDVLVPYMLNPHPCDNSKIAFTAIKRPPPDIISCFQHDSIEAKSAFKRGYYMLWALNKNGEVWMWKYFIDPISDFLASLLMLPGFLAGLLLGSLVWVSTQQLSKRFGDRSPIFSRRVLLLLTSILAVVLCNGILVIDLFRSPSEVNQVHKGTTIKSDEITVIVADYLKKTLTSMPHASRDLQTQSYDLISLSCQADWKIGGEEIPCPNQSSQQNTPFIAEPEDNSLLGRPLIDTALVMPVGWDPRWNMFAVYPPMDIQPGDHFRSSIGCLDMGDSCDVVFGVQFVSPLPGGEILLGKFNPSSAGQPTEIDLDLSSLAGKDGQFQLFVNAFSAVEQFPTWVNPTIGQHTPSSTKKPASNDTPFPTRMPTETPHPNLIKPGTYLVNKEIMPGIYRGESFMCYWARVKDLSDSFEAIIANDITWGQFYVEVKDTDFAFSIDCSIVPYESLPESSGEFPQKIESGIYLVGRDILPGTYRGEGGCYWARLKDVSGDIATIIASSDDTEEYSNNPEEQFYIQVNERDYALKTGCDLERVGD